MYTLSIILNLHRENELAQKTIENLNKVLTTKNSWINVECIAILDNSNEETKSIVYKNKNTFHTIEEVNYADLALSRNHGVNMATGNFILFADGDDYSSHNVLQSLYEVFYKHYYKKKNLDLLEDNQHIAVFPENLVWFPKISKMKYHESNDFMVQNNKFTHCYISKIALYKGLLKKYPIRTNTPPYGYEDWDLNNRLLESGVQFKVADYTLYYRKENNTSLLAGQVENKHLVRNSTSYDMDNICKDIIENVVPLTMFQKIYHLFFKKERMIKKNTIRKDIDFLESYLEVHLVKEHILFHSSEHYIKYISLQVEIYDELLKLFENKDKLYLNDSIKVLEQDIFQVSLERDVEKWHLLSEDDQLHIFMKVIMNSSINNIVVVNSDFGLKTIKYYHEIYKEFAIKIYT